MKRLGEAAWRARHGALCLLLALLSLGMFAHAKVQEFPGFGGPVAFDGNFYTLIGEHGYSFDGRIEHQQSTAFLPLMGLAIEAARRVIPGHSPLAEIAALGFVILLVTLLGIHRLTRTLAGEGAAMVAVLLWAFSPLAFYNFTGYADPLYALLTAWSLVFVVEKRWWGACLLAGLAMLTKPQAAVLVLFVVAALVWSRRAEWRQVLATTVPAQVTLAMLPIMVFASYGALAFGDSAVYANSLEGWRNGSFLDGNLPVWEAVPYFMKAASAGSHALSSWTVFLAPTALMMVFGTLFFTLHGSRLLAVFYVATLGFLFASISFDAINFARHVLFLVPWVVLAAIAHVQSLTRWWLRLPVLAAWLLFSISANLESVGRYYRSEWVS